MICCAPNVYLVQAKWFGARQMIIWFKPNDLFRAKWLFGSSQMIWLAPNDYLVQAKWFGSRQWLFGSSQMIWFTPNDYLVQAKWFVSRQMIIWFKPNDLARTKWLFGASQMIWRAPIKYYQLKYIFWRFPLKSSVGMQPLILFHLAWCIQYIHHLQNNINMTYIL